MGDLLTVGIADMKIGVGDDILITYALGSCIGTCLYDSTKKIIGLSHILLADSKVCSNDNNIYKFANTAIKELVRQMVIHGANTSRLVAKIAGGATMFKNSTLKIGENNIRAVINELKELGIEIFASDIGEDYGRTMECHASDGKVLIKSINKENLIL